MAMECIPLKHSFSGKFAPSYARASEKTQTWGIRKSLVNIPGGRSAIEQSLRNRSGLNAQILAHQRFGGCKSKLLQNRDADSSKARGDHLQFARGRQRYVNDPSFDERATVIHP